MDVCSRVSLLACSIVLFSQQLFMASFFCWGPSRTTGLTPRALKVGRGVND